ncbi:MAG: hypothetical protein GY697_16355 [Desulfobacterales bacterium]|nr:hypothetical protein [Desulfobacterales bacterium]
MRLAGTALKSVFSFGPVLRIAVGSTGLISGAQNVQVHGEAAADDKLGRGAVQIIGRICGAHQRIRNMRLL